MTRMRTVLFTGFLLCIPSLGLAAPNAYQWTGDAELCEPNSPVCVGAWDVPGNWERYCPTPPCIQDYPDDPNDDASIVDDLPDCLGGSGGGGDPPATCMRVIELVTLTIRKLFIGTPSEPAGSIQDITFVSKGENDHVLTVASVRIDGNYGVVRIVISEGAEIRTN